MKVPPLAIHKISPPETATTPRDMSQNEYSVSQDEATEEVSFNKAINLQIGATQGNYNQHNITINQTITPIIYEQKGRSQKVNIRPRKQSPISLRQKLEQSMQNTHSTNMYKDTGSNFSHRHMTPTA